MSLSEILETLDFETLLFSTELYVEKIYGIETLSKTQNCFCQSKISLKRLSEATWFIGSIPPMDR